MSIPNLDSLKPKVCLRCGESFQPNSPRRMYCSDACRRGTSTCKVCGKEFLLHGNTTGDYCSPECWYKSGDAKMYRNRECPACHKIFDARHPDQKYCGRECVKVGLRKRKEQPVCKTCGTPIPYTAHKKVYCSSECRRIGFDKTWKTNAKMQGSRRIRSDGYVLVKTNKTDWLPEHRVVMAEKIGRPLQATDRVHHKNGNRSDNRPENLELWTRDHKDPPGMRMIDKVKNLIQQLPPDERDELYRWLQVGDTN